MGGAYSVSASEYGRAIWRGRSVRLPAA